MLGLMQQQQLTTSALITHAACNHGRTEIVSRRPDGSLERSNWAEVAVRARKVASMFATLGAQPGDRIATLAWNRLPHLELYYGVTAGGMVLHTVNPRLFAEQIRYIVNHGGARFLCIDPDLLPILEPVIGDLPGIEKVIVLCAADEMPQTPLVDLAAYQELMASAEPIAAWPELDENTASSLCYTSGTTGNPKGVLYSHRATVLHAYAACAADSMALSARDTVLLAPPLFHVNAWGLPFTSAMVGAKLVMPGAAMDGASIYRLLRDEGVTFSLGVPTLWFTVLDYIARNVSDADRGDLKLNRVFMGGAATPRALIELFRDLLGVKANQAWGMTETSPVSTVCQPLASQMDLEGDAMTELLATQGRAVFGVELRVENAAGEELPRDGRESGLLKVRGPWVLSAYFGNPPGSDVDAHGWLDTGDIAKIDENGFLHLTDRAKDMIKSGGEWISSVDLENAAMAHPAVAEAAVIGVPHPRWQERPLLLLRLQPGEMVEKPVMLDHLAGQVAKWWLPDDVLIVDDLPHTATGKLLKTELRTRYRDHFGAMG